MDTAQLINALSRPEAYPLAVDRVEVRQTHISVLFLAGNRVYKVKKPVDLGYLDYTSLPQRRHFCQEEVRLNRRLARDVYLGVFAVVREPDGRIRFVAPEETADVAQIIDYAVEMRRLPEERMLSALLERGGIDDAALDDIADVIIRFHLPAGGFASPPAPPNAFSLIEERTGPPSLLGRPLHARHGLIPRRLCRPLAPTAVPTLLPSGM